jgi:nitrous oxidase accessory protein
VIRGLHVHGSGPGPTDTPCGIRIEADDVTVESTIVHDAYIGIGVKDANGVRLVANHITGREDAALSSDAHAVAHDPARHGQHAPAGGGRGDAISLWDADGILIRDNVLESARDGILVSFGSDVLIDRNMIHHSRYAIHSMYAEHLTVVENTVHDNLSGLVIMYGGPILALRNLVTDNLSPSTGFGVLLKDVVDARIRENTFLGNSTGIHVDGPTGATGPSTHFELNTVASNRVGVALYPSARSVFKGNSFAGNVVQAVAKGSGVADRNVWADRGLGNYWSSYRGYDAGAGIGAVPHVEGHGTDRLLEAAPVLTALASSPALRLLRSVEERWSVSTPVLTDPLPLTSPVARSFVADTVATPTATSGVAALGAALVLASLAPLLLVRRRREPLTVPGRLSRVYS